MSQKLGFGQSGYRKILLMGTILHKNPHFGVSQISVEYELALPG